jgi:hypothetical protein
MNPMAKSLSEFFQSRHAAAIATFVAASLIGAHAHADDQLDKARALFDAGGVAYKAGHFQAAIQAFSEAYALAPRPGIMFSIAQAHRRQYQIDKDRTHLDEAVRHYEEYLRLVPEGGRRLDCVEALAELDRIKRELPAVDKSAPPQPEVAKTPTRLMVSSPTEGAQASLDGAAPKPAPLIGEVSPGKHRVRVTCEGFRPEEREAVAVEGTLVPVDVALHELPASLVVTTQPGAEIWIDGIASGIAPMRKALEVEPGKHVLVVLESGHQAFARELDLRRAESKTVRADLRVTSQRKLSMAFMGLTAGSFIAGGVLAGLAVGKENEAKTLMAKRAAGSISPDELTQYDRLTQARGDLRGVAIGLFGGGAVLGAVSALLFAFDAPGLAMPIPRVEQRPAAPHAPVEIGLGLSHGPFFAIEGRL